MVGDNPASAAYVRGKQNDCAECGITCELHKFDDTVHESVIVDTIKKLNDDYRVDGIIVQLPLPKHLHTNAILEVIDPQKDVDCFRDVNIGKLIMGKPRFVPCTPLGIVNMLRRYNIDVAGKNCVVIGRSDIVGKPMATLLTSLNATVTVCHSQTKNISAYTKKADLIVCAVGRPKFLTADMVKKGVIVIDVGINRDENGKLCGDVDFDEVSKKAFAITPVPGGVGLTTRAALIENVVKACYIRRG